MIIAIPRPSFINKNIHFLTNKEELKKNKLKNILSNFDFEIIKVWKKTTDGNRANNVIIKTSKGNKLIKFYKKTLDRSTIIQEHSILEHLNNINFFSPILNSDKSGNSLFMYKDNYFALFDFVEGGFNYNNYYLFPNQKNKFIAVSGKILGILHNNLENFEPEGYNPDGFKSKKEDRYRNNDWFIKKLYYCTNETNYLKKRKHEYPLNWILKNIESIKNSLTDLDIQLQKFNLSRLIIHGDYGPYNLLFFKNKKVMVLDFEMARLEWRLNEIICAFHRFCRYRFEFDINKMIIFLKNYQLNASLKVEEINLTPHVWEFICIRDAIKSWYSYCNLKEKIYLIKISKALFSLNWIKQNKNTLLKSFSRIIKK